MASFISSETKRLFLITELLKYKPSSQNEILDHLLSHEEEISLRTLERYKNKLRIDFGLELVYDRGSKKYHIASESWDDAERINHFLGLTRLSEVFKESILKDKNSLAHIDFGQLQEFKGLAFLKSLLRATNDKQKVKITHSAFYHSKVHTYTLAPYVLKQYENRWYVYAKVHGLNQFRTFGVDRILSVEVIPESFIPDQNIAIRSVFSSIIGVSFPYAAREIIVLAFTQHQAKYLKTTPLHRSQKLIREENSQVLFEYYLGINYELKQQILKYGQEVEVIEPAHLKESIKNELEETLKKYL